MWWQDVGETPNIGQDGERALEMHREAYTGWESRKDTLEKEIRTFMQGKAAQFFGFIYHIHASYAYELLYYLLAWSFNAASQIIHLVTKHSEGNIMKSHGIFIFWVFKPTLSLAELCPWLNFGHCATCKEISSKKDAQIKEFSLCLSAKFFCI